MSLVILIQSEYCNLERFKRGDYGLIIQTLKNKGKKRSKEFCLFFFSFKDVMFQLITLS